MTRPRRALAILGSLTVALLLVSCGVEAGDAAQAPATRGGNGETSGTGGTGGTGGSSTTTSGSSPTTSAPTRSEDPSAPLTPEQQQLAETMATAYRNLGFTDEEATCLSEGIVASFDGASPDMTAMMDVVNQCDIPMDRLMEIQGGMGDGTPEGAFKESMAKGLEASGLSEEDATCIADGLVDEYGVDMEAMSDQSKVRPIADACGVDLSEIRPGG
jgi:hypothetical protein